MKFDNAVDVLLLSEKSFKKKWSRAQFDDTGKIEFDGEKLLFSGTDTFVMYDIQNTALVRRPFDWIKLLRMTLSILSVYAICFLMTLLVAKIPLDYAKNIFILPSIILFIGFLSIFITLIAIHMRDRWIRIRYLSKERTEHIYYLSVDNKKSLCLIQGLIEKSINA